MARYLMGVDNGGSAIKCAIFDTGGNEISVAGIEIPMSIPKPGFTERDCEEVWQANARVIRTALEKAGLTGADIAAVGLTGYGNGMVLLGEDLQPVYPAIVSTDDRASAYSQRHKVDGTNEKIFPKTRQTTWSAQPAAMLPWFKDNDRETYDRIRWVLGIKDYIRLRLTGSLKSEITDASSQCLVDLDTRDWDRELFEILGIEECWGKFPEILESTEVSGLVTAEGAALTGLAEGTPVAAGYFDIDANALASGILSDQELGLIAGTWSINEFLTRTTARDLAHKENVATLSYLKDHYIMEDSSPTSASNFNWFIENLLKADRKDVPNSVLYEECNRAVEALDPADSDVIFVPFLFASATEPNAKGAFLNLSGADDRNAMLRAVFEGVVFSSANHVHNLKRPIASYSKARLSGGVSNSEVWSQMMSDVLQIRVETLTARETGAMGAAMGAGVACGVFSGLEEAVDRMVHVGRVYEPRPETKEIYETKFRRYCKALEAVDLLSSIYD